jgi:hypothetical protein
MNIAADLLASSTKKVEENLFTLDGAVEGALRDAMELKEAGLDFLRRSNLPIGLVGEPFAWLGKVEAALGEAARGLQGLHASLHEALERLAPDAQKDGGGKEPPPKP